MTTSEQVQFEERTAAEQYRHVQKMQRGRRRAADRDWRDRLAAALRSIPRGPCQCHLRRGMTREELRELGAGCTDPSHICPRLDAIRRRLG